ncbi:hypothetical protein [Terrisporobacter petrolearius]|uniref:hypothetical protein n=1 Tax=Terrisporobacter petrolearius TaxID=1460447 RepID=UPI003B0063F1
MYSEKNNKNRSVQNMHDECKRLMNYHTIFTMKDGNVFDGIIEGVEGDQVIVLVGEDVMENDVENQCGNKRQFGPPIKFRRFRRRFFPLATLAALSLLPYPYYAPPYPYYPYYPY